LRSSPRDTPINLVQTVFVSVRRTQMSQVVRAAAFLLTLGSVSGFRVARRHQRIETKEDCAGLGDLEVNGTKFGDVAKLVCQYWPGDFPVTDVNKVGNLLEAAMGPGGAWEQIKKIRDERGERRGFCWRADTMRELSQTEECSMSHNDKCYGDCPYGYKPKLLTGKFAPVCNSACSDSNLPLACGFGCAKHYGSCAGALLQQIGSVTRAVASVYSALADDSELLDQVSRIILLTEFSIEVLSKVADTVKLLQGVVNGKEMSLEVIILLFQAVADAAPGLGEDFENLKGAMGEIVELMVSLLEADYGVDIDLGVIKTALLDHGESLLQSAVDVVRAFTYSRCEPASSVAFTLDDMGDERLMGPWVQRGLMNGKPKYTLRGSKDTVMQWNDGQNHWNIFVDRWCGVACRKVVYISKEQSYDFPVEGWTVASNGIAPAPLVIRMRPALLA